ncbi:MAG: Clp protease N-terminal domain-containing protein [Egibacteraceae bacterium]
MPFTRRSKHALELSLREALGLRHNSISTEHILLGLLALRDGLAARMLHSRGVTYDAARAAILARIEGMTGTCT